MIDPQAVEQLSHRLADLATSLKDLVSTRDVLQRLHERLEAVHESWSGSWAGWHAEQYYREFERPPRNRMFDVEWGGIRGLPEGWNSRSADDVRQFVQAQVPGADLGAIQIQVETAVDTARILRDDIVTELAPIRGVEGYELEGDLLTQIESLEWGLSPSEYLRNIRPSQVVSRDSQAMYQGLRTPPHLAVDAEVVSALTKIESIDTFSRSARRLLRQIELKGRIERTTPATADGLREVQLLCDRFHDVARQLRVRHGGRPTLSVEDEYDVQDLLHALLRIYFTDIRPEEWTPSYAGQSSRVDFLLKNEQIVVEVKKTRETLTAREVGNQLILDIARYQQHSDCRTLVCFVYDPEGRIGNPRGLETDLIQQSNDRLNVLVSIRPG